MKKVYLYSLLLTPLFFALYELFVVQNVNDPIKYIYTISGVSATVILLFSICISLLRKWINFMKYRKTIGLFGFFYALIHLLNFVILDSQLNMMFIIEETIDKPFIYLGMIAMAILCFMALTSTKKLFVKYNKYHKLIYLSLILITIHFIMAQKSLTLLQFFYIGIIIIIGYGKLLQEIIKRNKVLK